MFCLKDYERQKTIFAKLFDLRFGIHIPNVSKNSLDCGRSRKYVNKSIMGKSSSVFAYHVGHEECSVSIPFSRRKFDDHVLPYIRSI